MIPRRTLSTLTRVLLSSNKTGAPSSAASGGSKKSPKKEPSSPQESPAPKASGVSSSKPKVEVEEPFRNDTYMTPEYFNHNKFSFADVILALANQRLPQKSNQVKDLPK